MTDLNISDDLSLPNDAAAQTFAILAARGAGKTYTASVMAEEMLDQGNMICWIDPVGIAWGLRSHYEILIAGGDHADVTIDEKSGKFWAEFVVNERVPCILDVSDFYEADMRRFVADFATEFYQLQKQKKQTVHLILDEADSFCPQTGFTVEATKCLGAIQNCVRRGRSRGIGITLITQRSAVINKDVLTQTECLISMRTGSPHDLKAIEGWLQYHGTKEQTAAVLKTLPKLQRGEAWVYSPSWLETLKRVTIRERRSYDSSRTPKPGEVADPPRSVKKIDLAALQGRMAALLEESKANDPAVLRARIRELEQAQPVDQEAVTNAVHEAIQMRDGFWTLQIKYLRDSVTEAAQSQVAHFLKLCDEALEADKSEPQPPKILERFLPMPANPLAKVLTHKPMSSPIDEVRAIPQNNSTVQRLRNNGEIPPLLDRVAADGDKIDGPTRKILEALHWWAKAFVAEPTIEQVGFIAGYSFKGGSFKVYLRRAKASGLIMMDSNVIRLSGKGAWVETEQDEPTLKHYHQAIEKVMGEGPLGKILWAVVERGRAITMEGLGAATGYEWTGGSFKVYVRRFCSWHLAKNKNGIITPIDAILFPDALMKRK